MNSFEAPDMKKTAFNCPHCNAFSHQIYHPCAIAFKGINRQYEQLDDVGITICKRCARFGIWYKERLIFPVNSSVAFPNDDLPEEIKADYNEAKSILINSPRGAAALLRLAIQKLCIALGGDGKKLDDDIGKLVKNGLPIQVQQAMDILRVIGNNAVHPGSIDVKDNVEMASSLFGLINVIAETMITQPKQIGELYNNLPTGARNAIEKRDSPKG